MATFIVPGKCATKGSANSEPAERDSSMALDYIRGLIRQQDPDRMVYFVHQGEPVSKARARFNFKTRRTYTPERTQTAEEALAWSFRAAVKDSPWVGNVAIVAVFFRPNYQRIDADNLMKLVMDAGTKAGVWKDDSQVTHQMSVVELDVERPRTLVAMCPVASTLSRHPNVDFVCQRCQKPFSRSRVSCVGRTIKFCSDECRNLSQPKGEAKCPSCDRVFQRVKSAQRYCSNECRFAAGYTGPARPVSLCTNCGGRVSRREYLFCAKCRRKGRKPGSKNKAKSVEKAA